MEPQWPGIDNVGDDLTTRRHLSRLVAALHTYCCYIRFATGDFPRGVMESWQVQNSIPGHVPSVSVYTAHDKIIPWLPSMRSNLLYTKGNTGVLLEDPQERMKHLLPVTHPKVVADLANQLIEQNFRPQPGSIDLGNIAARVFLSSDDLP